MKRTRLGPRRLTPLIDHLSLYRATLIVAFRVAREATAEWVYQLRWAFAGGLFCQFIDSHFFSASLLRKDLVGCAPFSPPYGPFHGLGCPAGTRVTAVNSTVNLPEPPCVILRKTKSDYFCRCLCDVIRYKSCFDSLLNAVPDYVFGVIVVAIPGLTDTARCNDVPCVPVDFE